METIGRFQVLEKIGEGGFGVIHLGHDPHLGRRVAIKSCTSEDREMRDRFFQEARIAGNLHHRNVVTVYDFGVQGEVPYLVQEYLTGEDLDRKIKRKEYIPFPEKLHYLIQIARGLEYAHSQGVIHRDVKSANVRVLEDGTVKIMDFGIAKLAGQESGLTQAGETLGTASYLAPEQIRGQPVDQRTDIFSFGVLAYELLAYQRPFGGPHVSTVLYQILNEEPTPVSELAPDCPLELAATVARCLEKDPQRRYASCSELIEDLGRILRQRRADREGSGGLLASDLAATETARTRSLRRAPHGTAGELAEDLAELELAHLSAADHDSGAIRNRRALRQRGLRGRRWAAAAVVALLAAIAGSYLPRGPEGAADGNVQEPRGNTASLMERGRQPAAPAPEGGDLALAAGALLPADPPPRQSPVEPTPEERQEVAATDPEAAVEAPEDGGEEEQEQPPPPPSPSAVVIARAWSPAVTVRVAGSQHRLDRERRLELPPGRHTLQFALVEGDYRDFEALAVELAEGEERRVPVPLRPPGRLQIQPRIGTPPGEVLLGEDPLGLVPPIFDRRLRPGRYALRVRRPESQNELAQEVEVVAGRRTVATFDLVDGRWTVPAPRPLESPP